MLAELAQHLMREVQEQRRERPNLIREELPLLLDTPFLLRHSPLILEVQTVLRVGRLRCGLEMLAAEAAEAAQTRVMLAAVGEAVVNLHRVLVYGRL